MDWHRFTKPRRRIAGLITFLLLISGSFLRAQTSTVTAGKQGLGPEYDAAHEITVEGTIQRVVTQHMIGAPAGWHVMIAGPQGLVDAHLGPFLSDQTKSALRGGAPVQILGAMLSLNGKDFLLARQLTVGGRTVIVRSEHGLPVHERLPGESRPAGARKSNRAQQTGSGL
jgi:hypothetical protein